MSTLVVLAFPTDDGAQDVLDVIGDLQRQQLITLEDAATLRFGSDGKPTSMRDHDVEMMLIASAKPEEGASLQLELAKGDRVKIKEGSFQNFEGSVDSIDEQKGIVTVLLTIFGRATPVDVEYWQLEKV